MTVNRIATTRQNIEFSLSKRYKPKFDVLIRDAPSRKLISHKTSKSTTLQCNGTWA